MIKFNFEALSRKPRKKDLSKRGSSLPNINLVRFVLLSNTTGLYGGPTDTAAAQHRLTKELNQIMLTGRLNGDEPTFSDVDLKTFQVRHLLSLKSYFDLGSFSMIPVLWRYSKVQCAHISFARGITPYLFTIFCAINKTPVILQTHGMLTSRSSHAHKILDALITRKLVENSHRILALTIKEKESLISWHPKLELKVQVLGNPTNLLNKKSDEDSTNSVLFAARLHPRKRVQDFVNAAKISYELGQGIEYKVLGPDEGDLGIVSSYASELPNLEYLGSTTGNGVLEELSRSKVFALTSMDEPWGNVLISALAMGKPVVITSSSHLSTLIGDSQAGQVVPDKDPAAIAAAVAHMMQPNVYEVFAKNALELHRTAFSNDVVKNALYQLYVEAISKSARPINV